MALRNQPYLPLYIQDFLTDEKLIECSASATGVYIRIMCVMHKSDTYGKILLKQIDKQTDKQIKNFASKLAKHLPYTEAVIESALNELLLHEVLKIEGDFLIQKRMVYDNSLSETRARGGKKGGEKTAKHFAKAKPEANIEANSENENENGYCIDYFNKQGYSFPISGKVASEIDRFLNYRAKHQLHGPIKSGEQVEAIIVNFKDLNYTDEMISRAITDTIAKGAKNIICEQKPVTQQTTSPKIKNLT